MTIWSLTCQQTPYDVQKSLLASIQHIQIKIFNAWKWYDYNMILQYEFIYMILSTLKKKLKSLSPTRHILISENTDKILSWSQNSKSLYLFTWCQHQVALFNKNHSYMNPNNCFAILIKWLVYLFFLFYKLMLLYITSVVDFVTNFCFL